MNERQLPSFGLSGVLELLLRHKKKIVVCPLLAVLLGLATLVFWPRTYYSEAKLFLRVGRESVGMDPTATTGQTMGITSMDRKDEIKSAVDVLDSRNVAAKTVDRIGADVVLGRTGLGGSPRGVWADSLREPVDKLLELVKRLDPVSAREEAIVLVERQLSVHVERESNVISVWYEAKTPQLAQLVCNTLVQVYQEEHMRIYRNAESRPFFTEQRDRLRGELDEAQEAVRQAKDQVGIAGVDERRATLEAQFAAVELEKYSSLQQQATAKARVADLESQLAKIPERLVDSERRIPNQGADLLRDQLYALQMKAMDLEARLNENHPLVQAVREQLEDAQQVVAQQSEERLETTDAVNPIHRQLTLDLKRERSVLAGLDARLAELDKQKFVVRADLRALNQKELEIDQLQRQADLARGKFFQYAQNLEEARVDMALKADKISNISELQPATYAEKPVSPSRLLVALATAVLATAGTASLVLASEMLNDKLRTDAEVAEALGVPVLGTIPDGRKFQRAYRLRADGDDRRRAAEQPVLRS